MSGPADLRLLALLRAVERGEIDPAGALAAFHDARAEDLAAAGSLHSDLTRAARTGFPEVVYGEGKSADEIEQAGREILEASGRLVVTRVDAEIAEELRRRIPALVAHPAARMLTAGPPGGIRGRVVVMSAGTTDGGIAAEAAVTVASGGAEVIRIEDVGVAGLHRLLARRGELSEADVVIVVAGMEGALPSVVGGLTAAPVIAVPSGVGYGASLGGFAALAGMLCSCAPGVAVVNIANGFGAGFAALRILRARRTEP